MVYLFQILLSVRLKERLAMLNKCKYFVLIIYFELYLVFFPQIKVIIKYRLTFFNLFVAKNNIIVKIIIMIVFHINANEINYCFDQNYVINNILRAEIIRKIYLYLYFKLFIVFLNLFLDVLGYVWR